MADSLSLPWDAPDSLAHRQRERAENFPVALRALPRRHREHLHSVYAVARMIDDTGDEAEGDRKAQLQELRTDLDRIWLGERPTHPVLRQLAPTVRECDLEQDLFDRLVEANLQDQQVSRYATLEELLGYCRLSADPIGRIVLRVFGVDEPHCAVLSDRVCSALQLLEHWQDVREDFLAGRVYLPLEDLAAFGVEEKAVGAQVASEHLRRLMRHEIDCARALLESGAPLVGELHGWARLSVAGFVAGGRATADALLRTGGDVLGQDASPTRAGLARHLTGILLRPSGRWWA
jgi:squalene synthase HpnC